MFQNAVDMSFQKTFHNIYRIIGKISACEIREDLIQVCRQHYIGK